MADVIVVGASGHAKVVIDIVERMGGHRIVGLTDRDGSPTKIWGYSVLGHTEELPAIAARLGVGGYVLGVGQNAPRRRIFEMMTGAAPGVPALTVIHPSAAVGRDVQLGAGTTVMAGAIINPACTIGRACVVNTRASLDHDSVMGDYASLAPGVVVGGTCEIGEEAWIGIGATIIQQIKVGARATVGAGATVLRDVAPDVLVFGTPARVQATVER